MVMDMRKLVGANFGRLRRDRKLTQEEVEARSGFSQQYISALEQGKRNPTIVSLFELAQAIGVTHMELVQPLSPSEIESVLRNRNGKSKKKNA
ncbi:Xre family transcriptional regulator [Rhizobium subbaraonis]|uniref:Xre family transcriptional regulator n=2 Tax=Hyphomicrobiales TaxID=356 RepID=A0A285URT7_9HYPH|nr:Xre family transcriptional regulator [Rhizobium subbaraonis]